MHDLEITWPAGRARFSPDESPVEIGRSPDAAIILTEPSVSRRHIEFVWTGSAWAASDSSTHGSFDPIGVRLAPSWTIGTNTTIRLGGVEGIEVKIELVTTRPDGFDPHLGTPPPPVAVDQPPGPPSLADVGGSSSAYDPAEGSHPAAFDAPPPQSSVAPLAPEVPIAPPSDPVPAHLDAPSPDLPPPALPPPDLSPQDLPAPGPDAAPPAPPSMFDAPGGDAPAVGAAGFDAGEFEPPKQEASPYLPPAFEKPPPVFDAPHEEGSDQQPPPILAPAAYDPPPPGGAPQQPLTSFEAPPQPSPGFDAPPDPSPVLEQPAPDPGQYPNQGQPPLDQGLFEGPGGAGVTGIIPDPSSNTSMSDATIQLSIDGQDYTFMPGIEVTVGREPSCMVTVDERHSLVSRQHLKLFFEGDSWWLEDFSSKGTFVDGRPISGRYKAQGAFMAQLGDDDAGTPLRVITAGEHRAPRKQNLALLIAIAVLALIAIAALVLALSSRGDDNETVDASGLPPADSIVENNTPAPVENAAASDLVAAKQATVLLLGDEGLGSGFFVSDKLIVTNQHVAALAPSLFVAVSRQADERAVVEYNAETVARHPFLDIAVMKLTTDLAGNQVDSSGLTAVGVDDSLSLTLGDEVYNTGFPSNLSLISRDDMGELLLPPVGTNSGEAASFAIWPGCTNPDFASFIPQGSPAGVTCAPDGDVERGIVITTFSSGQGASGSPVFLNNQVIAVVFAGPLDDNSAGRNITTASFSTWLDDVISTNP